jgi:hypothetical protein
MKNTGDKKTKSGKKGRKEERKEGHDVLEI